MNISSDDWNPQDTMTMAGSMMASDAMDHICPLWLDPHPSESDEAKIYRLAVKEANPEQPLADVKEEIQYLMDKAFMAYHETVKLHAQRVVDRLSQPIWDGDQP